MTPRPCDLTQWQKVIMELSDGTSINFLGPGQVRENEMFEVLKVLFTTMKPMPNGAKFETIEAVKEEK